MRFRFTKPSVLRWVKFNLVGAVGIGVQLASLALLTAVFRVDYMLATGLAVEITVLHNFWLHERFTWGGVGSSRRSVVFIRLLRFNVTTGAISIGGNLAVMRILVGGFHMPTFIANLMSIAGCSVLNFLVTDRWVFRDAGSA